METAQNKQPLTITFGAETRAEREKRKQTLWIKPVQTDTVGYCGKCQVRYEGNHTKHQCKL
jgi:hypothetical protein